MQLVPIKAIRTVTNLKQISQEFMEIWLFEV
jgi:hypothetical protein